MIWVGSASTPPTCRCGRSTARACAGPSPLSSRPIWSGQGERPPGMPGRRPPRGVSRARGLRAQAAPGVRRADDPGANAALHALHDVPPLRVRAGPRPIYLGCQTARRAQMCRNCGTVYPQREVSRGPGHSSPATAASNASPSTAASPGISTTSTSLVVDRAIRAHKTVANWQRAARDLRHGLPALTGERAYGERPRRSSRALPSSIPATSSTPSTARSPIWTPRVAAAKINSLPADELTCPPNKPDRRLHAGYGMAGRGFSAVGMEGSISRSW